MKVKIEDLKKGMIVKVVFYYSQMPESFYTRELGIVEHIDIPQNLVTVQVLTHGFRSDRYVSETDFFIEHQRRSFVKNQDGIHKKTFYCLESCTPEELKEAEMYLQKHYQEEQKKLQRIKKSLKFLAELIKKAQN